MSTDVAKLLQGASISAAPPKPALDSSLLSVKRYVTFGFVTLFLLLGGLGGWAATTDLSGAVLGAGTVVVAGNVKKIQHPTGGVIGKLFVKNGDRVKAGDILVRLDETVTRAQLQVITKQMDELHGRQARLRAERDDHKAVTFPDDLLKREGESAVAQIVAGERTLFETRVSSREAQKNQLAERIAALKEEVDGLTSQAAAKERELVLIGKELQGLATLEEQKLVPTSKMMALRREGARLEGEKAQLQAQAGSTRGRIAEIEFQRIGIDVEAKSEVMKELRDAEGKLSELGERRTAAEDQLRRVDLFSPVDGIVHQMTVHTIGGVINTAEPLMQIVPDTERLVIEAKIAPQDIEQARMHEHAVVHFPAFNMRTTPSVNGRVKSISADLTHDERNNISYFTAIIEIPDEEMKKLNGQKLTPGMPADIQIATTSRTALSYLTKPVEDSFRKAFRER
jgi:HlyD family secretion protein